MSKRHIDMTKNPFSSFFKNYSKNVDCANNQYFWKLSDKIISAIIDKYLKGHVSRNSVILDAGGGTGRWIEILSRKYLVKFILLDSSTDMLKVARAKKTLKKLGSRLQIIQGDIQNMDTIIDSSVDYVTSIYNPISFVESPISFFREIERVLKPNGVALIMGQGFPNAIASKINNYLASSNELKRLDVSYKVKWNDSLLPLNIFSKESFVKLAEKSGLVVVENYGIPVFIQPGPEDFDSQNKLKSRVSAKLEKDPDFFGSIYNIEMKYNSIDSFVNRGMNLMVVLHKTSSET